MSKTTETAGRDRHDFYPVDDIRVAEWPTTSLIAAGAMYVRGLHPYARLYLLGLADCFRHSRVGGHVELTDKQAGQGRLALERAGILLPDGNLDPSKFDLGRY